MDRRLKRTVISIPDEHQPQLDFEVAEHLHDFMLPEYQRQLMVPRLLAALVDLGVVASIYLVFLVTTLSKMPQGIRLDNRVTGIYGVCFLVLVVVYALLFMLSAGQTPGMKHMDLSVVTKEDEPLDARHACLRTFGYLISILPLMLGFVWMLVDPEHLTWADKVSGTWVKKTVS